MKRKSLTMILCLLTCLSLVGVGFAAWVITAPAEDTVTGNIVVDTVTDNRYELTVESSNQSINLTGPETATSGWLTSDTATYAVLSAEFKCTLTKKSGDVFADTNEVNVVAEFTEPTAEAYVNAKDANCFSLGGTENEGYVISELALSEDNTSITFTVTVEYKWGTIFDNQNPFTYYNSKTVNGACGASIPAIDDYPEIAIDDATWGDHANYYLTLLSKITSDVEYSLKITAEPATVTA